jgi:hypothetical protein
MTYSDDYRKAPHRSCERRAIWAPGCPCILQAVEVAYTGPASSFDQLQGSASMQFDMKSH